MNFWGFIMEIPIYKKNLKELLNNLKSSAKKRGIYFDLSLSDLNNLSFPITCPILGIELKFNSDKMADNSYSIDRIDSQKGYVIDNLIVISAKANRLKNNGTLEEIEKIMEFYKKLRESI